MPLRIGETVNNISTFVIIPPVQNSHVMHNFQNQQGCSCGYVALKLTWKSDPKPQKLYSRYTHQLNWVKHIIKTGKIVTVWYLCDKGNYYGLTCQTAPGWNLTLKKCPWRIKDKFIRQCDKQ